MFVVCWQVYMLVDRFGENLQKELMMQLYCDHTFKQLMSVSGDQPRLGFSLVGFAASHADKVLCVFAQMRRGRRGHGRRRCLRCWRRRPR